MSGVHNHGHHHVHGAHGPHGNHGAAAARASGQKTPPTAASTPAAQAQGAQQAQHPSMDTAMAALDQAIKGLAANFHADSFNNQKAPEGIQAAPSTLTNAVGSRNQDLFLESQAAGAPAPATNTTTALADPILNIKGGGGISGGVLKSDTSFLGQSGGGGISGGVLKS